MADPLVSSGVQYTYVLLAKWEEIITLGEQYRENLIVNRDDAALLYSYISKLTRIWLELYPKVRERKDEKFKDISDQYEGFRKYYLDPIELTKNENADDLFELEMMIREVLERLGVTDFGR